MPHDLESPPEAPAPRAGGVLAALDRLPAFQPRVASPFTLAPELLELVAEAAPLMLPDIAPHVWEAHCRQLGIEPEPEPHRLVDGQPIPGGLVFREGRWEFIADDCDVVKLLSGETLEVRVA